VQSTAANYQQQFTQTDTMAKLVKICHKSMPIRFTPTNQRLLYLIQHVDVMDAQLECFVFTCITFLRKQ